MSVCALSTDRNTPPTINCRDFESDGSPASAPLLIASSLWGLRRWSVSSQANRCVASMNAYWGSRAQERTCRSEVVSPGRAYDYLRRQQAETIIARKMEYCITSANQSLTTHS